MSDRLLPTTTRGNAASIVRELKGTHDEIWTKYLKVFHKNKTMAEDDWRKVIKQAGKVRAKAYA